jgi:hypothetical protein
LCGISFPPRETPQLPQPIFHPGTAHPEHKGLRIPLFPTFCRISSKQREERHALDTTPPHRRKIHPIARASTRRRPTLLAFSYPSSSLHRLHPTPLSPHTLVTSSQAAVPHRCHHTTIPLPPHHHTVVILRRPKDAEGSQPILTTNHLVDSTRRANTHQPPPLSTLNSTRPHFFGYSNTIVWCPFPAAPRSTSTSCFNVHKFFFEIQTVPVVVPDFDVNTSL